MPRLPNIPRKLRRRALACLAVLIVAFIAATARLLAWPVQGGPAQVDAIVMLAGPGERLSAALALAREHRAPVLVVSRGWRGYGGPCPPPTRGVRTICFDPDPGDTRGEAEHVAALARRNGWHSLLIVAIGPQVARAQLLFRRCFGGQVFASAAGLPAWNWPYQIAYGWGALMKAVFVVRGC